MDKTFEVERKYYNCMNYNELYNNFKIQTQI